MMAENYLENQITPLISIIIPFYNTEDFLREAVESVLNQTVKDWELVLVDDGSTDKSLEIAEEFKEKHPNKIVLLSHNDNENKGANAARNLGFADSKGKFITFLDADDVFYPDTLERELKVFNENSEADAVCGTMKCWFSWSDEARKWEKDFKVELVLGTEKLYQPPDLLIDNLKADGSKPGINCVMVKSEFAKTVGLFEEDYRHTWEDQVIWAKLTLNGSIYVMDAVLAKYRQHPASTSSTKKQNGQDILSKKIFLDWLEAYLQTQMVEDENVWKAFRTFRRKVYLETNFKKLKQIYTRLLPLHLRFKIRDNLTKAKQFLSRSAHRHK